jgi:hypothetical protein
MLFTITRPILFGFLLMLSSCSVSLFPGYKAAPMKDIREPFSWFQSDTGYFLFNIKVDLAKNHFTGLLAAKETGKDTFRVVMITEVGLKLFDFEFIPKQEMKVHYLVDAMNRQILIKTLSEDIGLVLMHPASGTIDPAILIDKNGNIIFRYRDHCKKSYYYHKENAVLPYYARRTKGISNKAYAEFFGNKATGIDSIKLAHENISLNIQLNRITE